MESQAQFEEEEVDENLTSFLAKPIQTHKRTFTETFKEDVEDSDAEDQNAPASHKTKEEIYRVWTSVTNERADDLLPLIQNVSKLTEVQAQTYLACLKAANSQTIHKHLSVRLLVLLSSYMCHPEDPITPQVMEEDPFLINGISMVVSDILTVVGKFALPLLLAAYGGTSWYWFRKNHPTRRQENKTSTTSGTAVTTVQNDGMREVSDGQDITHDKTNDGGMDTHL